MVQLLWEQQLLSNVIWGLLPWGNTHLVLYTQPKVFGWEGHEPKEKHTTAVTLNEHVVKPSSKYLYLCPRLDAILSLEQKSYLL